MKPVRSSRNPRVARAVRLRRASARAESGLTLLEGPNLLEAAVGAGATIVEAFGLPEDSRSRALVSDECWVSVTQDVLDRLAPTENPRGPVAVVKIPVLGEVTRDSLSLGVGDPGNAGTLIRTAAAFGLDVVRSNGAVDLWSPKVLRAAAGGHYRTTIGNRQRDAGLIASVVSGGDPLDSLELDRNRPWSILVGSEPHGLSEVEIAGADVRVTIPMVGGTESLNAAVAGSIVAFYLRGWRNAAGPLKRLR